MRRGGRTKEERFVGRGGCRASFDLFWWGVESTPELVSRAQGCLLGQLAGDSLGSLVEFKGPAAIVAEYPDGVRRLADGGTWDTIAGQPTDDSEMALLLARMLVETGRYEVEAASERYRFWLDSEPFDCGGTIEGSWFLCATHDDRPRVFPVVFHERDLPRRPETTDSDRFLVIPANRYHLVGGVEVNPSAGAPFLAA